MLLPMLRERGAERARKRVGKPQPASGEGWGEGGCKSVIVSSMPGHASLGAKTRSRWPSGSHATNV